MDSKEFNEQNKQIWDANAHSWDAHMGEKGNDWHKELVGPKVEELLNLHAGGALLDVGCGNGLFARRMAEKGVHVTAFDFSQNNIDNAKKYESTGIEYLLLDATDTTHLARLKNKKFHGIAANMVLMDMPSVTELFASVPDLLASQGSFVFAIQHPCFNSEFAHPEENGDLLLTHYMKVNTSKGIAIDNQPEQQYYFHRPLSYYLQLAFENGLVVTGFEEPVFEGADEVYAKFPPVIIVRLAKRST